jgi:copper(I)-binding protein
MTSQSTFPFSSLVYCLRLMTKGAKIMAINVAVLLLMIAVMLSAKANADGHAQDETAHAKAANMASINGPWARATFALAKSGAAYFAITNTGSHEIVLTSVAVDSSIAMMAELHHTVMQDDMMRMQELEDGIIIKAGATLEFSPGGMHVMLMGLQKPLSKNESIIIELYFEDGSQLTQIFPILDKRN